MKSFNEYVEGVEGKDHEDKGNRIMKIAQSCFNTALDLVDDYNSLDDAVDSYALNAMHSAREEGLSDDDAMEAQSAVDRLYDKYKEKLKNK